MNIKPCVDRSTESFKDAIHISDEGIVIMMKGFIMLLVADYKRKMTLDHDNSTGVVHLTAIKDDVVDLKPKSISIHKIKDKKIFLMLDNTIRSYDIEQCDKPYAPSRIRRNMRSLHPVKLHYTKALKKLLGNIWQYLADIHFRIHDNDFHIIIGGVRRDNKQKGYYSISLGKTAKPTNATISGTFNPAFVYEMFAYIGKIEKRQTTHFHIGRITKKGDHNSILILEQDSVYEVMAPTDLDKPYNFPDKIPSINWLHLDNPVISFKALSEIVEKFEIDLTLTEIIHFYLHRTWSAWRKTQYHINKYYYHIYTIFLDYHLQNNNGMSRLNVPKSSIDLSNSLIYSDGELGIAIADKLLLDRFNSYLREKDKDTDVCIHYKMDGTLKTIFGNSIAVNKIKHYSSNGEVNAFIIDAKGLYLIVSAWDKMQEICCLK